MKNNFYIRIFAVLCVIFSHTLIVASNKTDSIYVADKDSVSIIPEKKFLGRVYDRGVLNHLFVKKNTWMVGLTVTHGQYTSEDVQFLSFIKDFDCKANIFALNPYVGYFLKENIAVGLKFGYQNIYAGLENLNIDIDDGLSLAIKNMSFEEILYKTTFFHRSYVGIDKGKRFGLFNETSLSYNMGYSRYIRGNEEMKETHTKIMEMNIALNPGAAVFIMENVCAELSFGIVGFRYRQEKQTTNGISSGWRKSSGANFKINLFNVSIGIVAII